MPSTSPPTRPLSGAANKRIVVRGILRGLMAGRWKGNERITEATAVELFGVSRTPVREAMLELQGLGLLELRRNCGAVVLPFGETELREMYSVRALLESEAARLAATRIAPGDIERLHRDFLSIRDSDGIDPDWRHDRDLHRLVAESSGNRRLLAEIARYGELVQTIREIVVESTSGIHHTSADEHLRILAALAARDPEASATAMRRHLQQASESAVAAMDRIRGE